MKQGYSGIGEKGMALYISLGFITLLAILAGGFVAIGLRSSQLESDHYHSSNALSNAEAGIHFAMGQINAGEIVPPEPSLEDSAWMDWVDTLETPGYGSEVEIRYIKDLMLPHFKYDGSMNEEDERYLITSVGQGPRKTERTLQIVMKPEGLTPYFDYALFFGGNANFSGNPVTFSGHFDTLRVQLDGNNPFFDINGNGVFDKPMEWGWSEGTYQLDKVKLSYAIPLSPVCTGLQYGGHIHSNGNLDFIDHPHFNGKGSAVGEITQDNGNPFVNVDNRYFRSGHTNFADYVEPVEIPTDLAFWEEVAEDDSMVHIITPWNVGEFPGWSYVGGTFKWGGGAQMEEGTYYLTDDVQISGNSSGNSTIITNHTLKVNGTTESWSELDLMGYIAGGDLTVDGGQYIQGLVYTKSNMKFTGGAYIFGAVWVKGGGDISGNPIVVFNTALRDGEFGWNFKPTIISWQELYE